MSLRDWFLFKDRDSSPYNLKTDTMITVERSWENENSNFNSEDWQKEEWLVKSALVPAEHLEDLANQLTNSNYLDFEYGWNYDDEFQFGDRLNIGSDYPLFPFVMSYKHPISKELIVDLNPKFIIYHALNRINEHEYHHPIDPIIIAKTSIDDHELYEPSPFTEVHISYLKDFLAATNMGLLITIIADRFANSKTKDGLQLQESEWKEISKYTWLTSSLHDAKFNQHGHFSGRSTLSKNIIIEPAKKPAFERSPWYYFGDQLDEGLDSPRFIIDANGSKKSLPKNTLLNNYIEKGIGEFGYIYFRPEVLQRFIQTEAYSVNFHMRNWGVASLPGGRGTVDVGINSKGLVTAFGPDIADLPISEQAYWASHTSLPSGEICKELFETRMQLKPPHSPSVIELIQNVRDQLNLVFEKQFSESLYQEYKPDNRNLSQLSVGPILNDYSEVTKLTKVIYEWLIESMMIASLRNALEASGNKPDKQLRQIKLLEQLLTTKGFSIDEARKFTSPLVGLYDLRIAAAHIGGAEIQASLELMIDDEEMLNSPRQAYELCVDSIVKSMNSIAETIKE